MANNDLTNNEKILVKVDQNNLILIDPNSTVSNGIVEPRDKRRKLCLLCEP